MKIQLPKPLLNNYIAEAKEGYGRETEIGGGNRQVDITILGSDVAVYPPEIQKVARGTVRLYFNKKDVCIGHKVIGPEIKRG